MKRSFMWMLKALFSGVVYFTGNVLGGQASTALGLAMPAMPPGSDPARLMLGLGAASLGMGCLMVFLATRMRGRFVARWAALTVYGWLFYSLGNQIEAVIYTTYSAGTAYKLVMDAAAFGLSAVCAAALTAPAHEQQPGVELARGGVGWRTALAWLAFPLIYLSLGRLISPWVEDVNRQGLMGLTAPGWGQILTAQALRSLVFLGGSLLITARWARSRRALLVALTASQFLLVGGFYMVQAYWYPAGFRLIHSLEILLDSAIYSASMVKLFATARTDSRA